MTSIQQRPSVDPRRAGPDLLEPEKADALRNAESFEDVVGMLARDDEESSDPEEARMST